MIGVDAVEDFSQGVVGVESAEPFTQGVVGVDAVQPFTQGVVGVDSTEPWAQGALAVDAVEAFVQGAVRVDAVEPFMVQAANVGVNVVLPFDIEGNAGVSTEEPFNQSNILRVDSVAIFSVLAATPGVYGPGQPASPQLGYWTR